MPARFSGLDAPPVLDVAPLGADVRARPRGHRGKGDAVLLVRLLDPGRSELFQDHACEVLLRAVVSLRLGDAVQEFVVLVDDQYAVRGQALDRERTRHPHLPVVLVGLVVEVLVVRLCRDGVVDLLLSGDARLPPQSMRLRDLRGPCPRRLAGNLPLLPLAIEPRVEVIPQRLQHLLPTLPDDVDLSVVSDRLQGDVRHPFADEALPNITPRRLIRRNCVRDLGFSALAVRTVGQQVVRVTSPHDARSRERQGNSGGVYGDPATTPLFGDVTGRTRSTCRIQHKIAWIRCHQHAPFDYSRKGLNNVQAVCAEPTGLGVRPYIENRSNAVVSQVVDTSQRLALRHEPVCIAQTP